MQWCIPTVDAEFVSQMEDTLDLYAEPYDPNRPVICLDELPYQMVDDVLLPLPIEPGCPERYDYEYERNGTCNIFGWYEHLAGRRHMSIRERRTAIDFAHVVRDLVDNHYPEVEVIRLVVDNLNTHRAASFYKAFSPEEAARLRKKIQFHWTPNHGSWLNMIEIEFSVLSNQCTGRRIGDMDTLKREVAAWEAQRNAEHATINWRFTSADARSKLKRLYPSKLN